MPEPQYVRRSYSGGSVVSQLVQQMGSTDTSFTIAPVTGWVEEDGQPLGAVGPFTVVIDRFTPQVEKILCQSINLSTGLISVYVATDGWSGRGYDGTTAITHVPSGSTSGVQTCWSSKEADEANQAVFDLLGIGGLSSLGVPIGVMVPFAGTPATLPPNYLVGDGTPILRSTYSALFAAITIPTIGTTTAGGTAITGVSAALIPYITTGHQITLINSGGAIYTVSSASGTTITLTSGVGITAGAVGAFTVYPHGAGNGSTTFNLPDSRGRISIGQGAVGTNSQPSLWVGGNGGEQLHTLVQTELSIGLGSVSISDPSHNHNIGTNVYINNVGSSVGPVAAGGSQGTSGLYSGQLTTLSATGITATITNAGGGQGHNNMQPYLVATHIVRAL